MMLEWDLMYGVLLPFEESGLGVVCLDEAIHGLANRCSVVGARTHIL